MEESTGSSSLGRWLSPSKHPSAAPSSSQLQRDGGSWGRGWGWSLLFPQRLVARDGGDLGEAIGVPNLGALGTCLGLIPPPA